MGEPGAINMSKLTIGQLKIKMGCHEKGLRSIPPRPYLRTALAKTASLSMLTLPSIVESARETEEVSQKFNVLFTGMSPDLRMGNDLKYKCEYCQTGQTWGKYCPTCSAPMPGTNPYEDSKGDES